MNNKNKNIEELFKQAKNVPALMNVDEINTVVNKSNDLGKTKSTSLTKTILNLKNLIIMTAFISALLVVVNFLPNMGDEKTVINNETESTISQSKDINGRLDEIDTNDSFKRDSNSTFFGIETLKLDESQLKGLGFTKGWDKFHPEQDNLKWYNSIEGIGILRVITNLYRSNSRTSYSNSNKERVDTNYTRLNKGLRSINKLHFYPMYITRGGMFSQVRFENESWRKFHKEYRENMLKNLVPVEIVSKNDNYPDSWIYWFTPTKEFFEAIPVDKQDRIREQLSQRSSFEWSTHILDYSEENETFKKKAIIASNKFKQDLSNLSILEIGQEHYEKLGIHVDEKTVSYRGKTKKHGPLHFTISKLMKTVVANESVDTSFERRVTAAIKLYKEQKARGDKNARVIFPEKRVGIEKFPEFDFYPVLATNIEGGQYFFGNKGKSISPSLVTGPSFSCLTCKDGEFDNKYLNNEFNTLVPILIGKDIEGINGGVILWFKVSPSFFAALPEEIGQDMQREYNGIMNDKNGINSTQNSRETTCNYFEVCRFNISGVHGFKVYPNPVKESFNIDFHSQKNMEIKVDLMGIDGSFVKQLSDFKPSTVGKNKGSYELYGVPSGIYLLTLENKDGQKMTHRLIVN